MNWLLLTLGVAVLGCGFVWVLASAMSSYPAGARREGRKALICMGVGAAIVGVAIWRLVG